MCVLSQLLNPEYKISGQINTEYASTYFSSDQAEITLKKRHSAQNAQGGKEFSPKIQIY